MTLLRLSKKLQAQLNNSMQGVNVNVMLSDGIVSDAAAGSDRIKLNQDVKFLSAKLDILEVHEGWDSHWYHAKWRGSTPPAVLNLFK